VKRLIDFYPRRWRERYGAELEAFVARRQASFRVALDVLRGAIDAHLHPELVTRRSFSALAASGAAADDLVFVPSTGFRSVHALGTPANVVVVQDGRTLTAAITPDRDGIRLQFTVTGIPMVLEAGWRRFDDPVGINDDHGRDISTPRPRWQVGGTFQRTSEGNATLSYKTLLHPLARDVGAVTLELSGGAAGDWNVRIPVEPEGFTGAPAVPIDASDTKYGITIAARAVSRAQAETAIELEAYFDPPEPVEDPRPARRWVRGIGCSMGGAPMSGYPMREQLALRDDTGHEHTEHGQSFVDPLARKHREVVMFPALAATSAVLEIKDVWTSEITDQTVTVPVPGQMGLSIAGCEARVAVSRAGEHADTIRIDVTPLDPDADRQLLYLDGLIVPGGDPRGTIGMSVVQCVGQRPYVQLPDPTQKVHEVTLRGPIVMVRGPWTLEILLAPA
jgi:hypothetical protein